MIMSSQNARNRKAKADRNLSKLENKRYQGKLFEQPQNKIM